MIMTTLEEMKKQGTVPEWYTAEALTTVSKGYLLDGETVKDAYKRIAASAAKYIKIPGMEEKFFDAFWKNWLCPSSPVFSNSGTRRGHVISCFGQYVADDLDSIFQSFHETAMLTKGGGGIGKYWGALRQRGAKIGQNGTSDGIIPWLKVEEAVIRSTSQGGVRRGSSAAYLPITSNEIEEFLDIRRPTGDASRRCQSINFHHAVCIPSEFMSDAKAGRGKAREVWQRLLTARHETGEAYLFFDDIVNENKSPWYKNKKIHHSQLCNEIYIPNNEEETYVCCLSSLNLARWEEWKNTDIIRTSIFFLDAMISEFIDKASGSSGFEKAVRGATRGRTLGLGVLGWHTLLQSKMMPFDSFDTMQLNASIFRKLKEKSDEATRELAVLLGECEHTKGFGVRNATLLAVAPTVTNSLISGNMSQGIEPLTANTFVQKTAKGDFFRSNPILKSLLQAKGKDDYATWMGIDENAGSIQHVSFLTAEEKAVFLTAREINQFAIVRQAGQRQKFIDQGASTNLFFAAPETVSDAATKQALGKYIHGVHMEAFELGVKGLYYVKPESVLKGQPIFKDASDCASCES